jgi:1-aminocyclopropane-1-carboxylate deaminase
LVVKREDLNHPRVSGNKWWKLKHNLQEVCETSHKTILTFGGAFSNHIYATAAAAAELELKSIGIIRGEEMRPSNHTLRFAEENGMRLHFVSREQYKKKTSPDFLEYLRDTFGNFYLVPEGGSNLAAVKGCAEFAMSELSSLTFDHLLLPVGTGGTIAGIICGMKGSRKVTGVSVLKNGAFLADDIRNIMYDYSGEIFNNWSLLTGYDHGGYAKYSAPLLAFMKEMKNVYNLPLDHVYTGKLMWAIFREIESGAFQPGEKILMLHTGGLQGNIIK